MYGMGFGLMDSIVPFFFLIIFIIIIGNLIASAVQSTKQWSKNNNSPVLTVEVDVVAKRQDVGQHNNSGIDANGQQTMHYSTYSNYYVTFQVQSGDRLEFHVNGSEYGMIVEGDHGMLTFQGTRFLEFQRR